MPESVGADKLAEQAMQAYQANQLELAIERFRQALEAYRSSDQQLQAAEMANNLSVALSQIGRHQAALEVLEGTFSLFVEHDESSKAAQALGNQAAAYEGLHQWEQAEALYLQAAERFQSLGEEENRRYTLQALSRIRLRLGRPMEAVSTMQGALEGGKSSWRDRLIRKILALPGRILKP